MDSPKTLLLGLGNASRSGDSAGWEVVCLLDFLRIPGLETRVADQLGLDLLEKWDGFDRVVFVDAAVNETEVRLGKVGQSEYDPAPPTHHLRPETILAVSKALNTHCPELYLCRVPVQSFEFGEPCSYTTRRQINEAVRLIVGWLSGNPNHLNVEAERQHL